jgi:hypothetical protein
MMRLCCLITVLFLQPAFAAEKPSPPEFYRGLTTKVRSDTEFKVAMPVPGEFPLKYHLALGAPVYPVPLLSDMHIGTKPGTFLRSFWDRILATDESYIEISGEKLPITCIFVSGQDNRYANKDGPRYPDFILRVYLVVNDYSCQGPIKPGWPESGGRKDAWDTYLYYEIHDPTVMLPMEAHVRYRWSEFPAVLIDRGPK